MTCEFSKRSIRTERDQSEFTWFWAFYWYNPSKRQNQLVEALLGGHKNTSCTSKSFRSDEITFLFHVRWLRALPSRPSKLLVFLLWGGNMSKLKTIEAYTVHMHHMHAHRNHSLIWNLILIVQRERRKKNIFFSSSIFVLEIVFLDSVFVRPPSLFWIVPACNFSFPPNFVPNSIEFFPIAKHTFRTGSKKRVECVHLYI